MTLQEQQANTEYLKTISMKYRAVDGYLNVIAMLQVMVAKLLQTLLEVLVMAVNAGQIEGTHSFSSQR